MKEDIVKLRAARKEFLDDMVAYYRVDPAARRSVDSRTAYYPDGYSYVSNQCTYAPIKETSEGCAIGRCLSREQAELFDKNSSAGVATVATIFIYLPEKLKALGRDFLTVVQAFHDVHSNWVDDVAIDYRYQLIINEFIAEPLI
jgi:hypothetical protein